MDVLIDEGVYEIDVFLLVPQLERNDIVMKYLRENKNKQQIDFFSRIRYNQDFYGRFYSFLEQGHFVRYDNSIIDWENYEKKELVNFAKRWCIENQIKFSVK